MTFESMIDNVTENPNVNANVNPVVNEEALAVKVSYGDDIRRATFTGTAYVALRDLCAKLFELDPNTAVLKYQDEDGDKITVTSDSELQSALQLAKEKKILRLFVDAKVVPVVEEAKPSDNAFPCWRREGSFPGRGGFHSRGGFMHHGVGGHPGFQHHGFPGGNGFQHHGFPHAGRGGFPHHGGFPHPHPTHFGPSIPFSPASPNVIPTELPQQPTQGGSPAANYRSHRVVGHGAFSPADAAPFPHPHPHPPHHRGPMGGPYARCGFKERKHEMKEHIKFMKMNASTEEDRQAIKDIKNQMKAECKERWQDLKAEKATWKAEKKAQKKAHKKEWKDDKKCEKNDRLVARHVADVTIPDNSELPADTPVTKTWRLRNAGLLAWPADSQLIFVSRRGDNLNGPERVSVGAVEPQQEVDVSVTFITPVEPGRYIGYYRMATADGNKFGQRVWVSFIIPTPGAAPTAPTVDATLVPTSPTAPLVDATLSPAPAPAPAPATKGAPDAADDFTMHDE